MRFRHLFCQLLEVLCDFALGELEEILCFEKPALEVLHDGLELTLAVWKFIDAFAEIFDES
jgi:hypothetical protein